MPDHEFLRYFDSEMRYLQAATKEFAQQYPEAARRLGVDEMSLKREDAVDRLFQGFSLMMARMRQKIDDDIPELTEPLLSQLLPVVNRTLPSMAIVELTPADLQNHIRQQTLPSGTQLLSLPVITRQYQQGNRCPYRTVNDLVIHPFSLSAVNLHTLPNGSQTLNLRFVFPVQNEPRTLHLRHIPLYLTGDRVQQSLLYLTLTQQVSRVRLHLSGDLEWHLFEASFSPQWQTPQPSLWPQSDSPALCGEIRPWLEYFTAPARFYFLQLHSDTPVQLPANATHIDLELTLSERLPYEVAIPQDAIRMHCVPLINLFRLTGEPLVTLPAVKDYRLRPHRLTDGHTEIYSVDTLDWKDEEDDTRYPYVPYSHFRGKGGMLKYEHQWPERFFHTRTSRGVSGLHETVMMLGGKTHEQMPGARLMMDLTCTNGALPRMALQQALFDADYTTGNLNMRGVTRSLPTLPRYPPTAELYQWHLLALLHPRALSQIISCPESLGAALMLFDWTFDENNRRRVNGIRQVSYAQAFNASKRWHGVRIRVELDEHQFTGTGDARLFSEILEQFFTQYASAIRFTQLTVELTQSGTEWTWPERRIKRVLM